MRHLLPLRYIDAIAKAGSIRKAAQQLAITSTALNRRILSMEEELGVPIFERMPRGVRLSTAGEILIHHIRNQLSDMERVKSQIADLSGVRRGHVAIACSQALLPYLLPKQIAHYRARHPAVTFGVFLRDRTAAEQALLDHTADIALVFEPLQLAEFQTLIIVPQPVYAVMAPDHPLAAQKTLRLRDCLRHPVAIPSVSYGVRHLLEKAIIRSSLKLEPVIESDSFEFLRNYVMEEQLISFQIPIGLSQPKLDQRLTIRSLDQRDVPMGWLYLGQLRGRTLPVAAALFADQLANALQSEYG